MRNTAKTLHARLPHNDYRVITAQYAPHCVSRVHRVVQRSKGEVMFRDSKVGVAQVAAAGMPGSGFEQTLFQHHR